MQAPPEKMPVGEAFAGVACMLIQPYQVKYRLADHRLISIDAIVLDVLIRGQSYLEKSVAAQHQMCCVPASVMGKALHFEAATGQGAHYYTEGDCAVLNQLALRINTQDFHVA